MNDNIKVSIFLVLLFGFIVFIFSVAINLNDKNKIGTYISCSEAKNLELYIRNYQHHGSDKYILVKIKD